jgi:basic membrane protein A
VIAVGFLMSDTTAAVAKRFPNVRFGIVDVSAPFMKGKPKNVRGIVFAEQEAGCLAGVAAATVSQSNVISSVGGLKIPPVDAFIAGYQFCAKRVKSGITTLNGYSQDFVDQAKCKEVALQQMGEDADVVFQVAGGCGLGAIQGAKEQGKWGIGVDTDQSFLGTQVLTSATKKVDVGVFTTIQLAKSKAWKGGVDTLFNVKNKGVGYGKVSTKAPSRAALIGKLNLWSRNLASGKVKPPRTVAG